MDTFPPSSLLSLQVFLVVPTLGLLLSCSPTAEARTAGSVRIINGEEAVAEQFPWQAAVVCDRVMFCGGSILSDEWILTAAHCVDGHEGFQISVGSVKRVNGNEKSAQSFETREKFRHPQYNSDFYDNDVALLHLSTKIKIDNKAVKPVKLPSYTDGLKDLENKEALVSGWGHTKDGDDALLTDDLLYTTLMITSDDECVQKYKSLMTSNKLCCHAQFGHSSCLGDSGGALVIKEEAGTYKLVGMASFGNSQGCTKRQPLVYTRITSFLPYIESITGITVEV